MRSENTQSSLSTTAPLKTWLTTRNEIDPELTTLSIQALSLRAYRLIHRINQINQALHNKPADYHELAEERSRVRDARSAILREISRRGERLESPFEARWQIKYRETDDSPWQFSEVRSEYFASKEGWNGQGVPTTTERIDNMRRAESAFYHLHGGRIACLNILAGKFLGARLKEGWTL